MLKRLRFKFICITMIIVTVMLGIIFGTVLHFTQENLEQDSLTMMRSVALNPMRQTRPGASSDDLYLPFFTLQISPFGDVIASGTGHFDLSDEAFLRELIDRTFSAKENEGVLKEYNLRYFRTVTPTKQVLVFADISTEARIMENLIKSCLLIGGLSFVVFLFISILLARWAVKPVEQTWEQQKQFVADASHELKTPLTVITTSAELLQNQEYTPENQKLFSDSILTMARQMRGLITDMLDLARADQGSANLAVAHTDFSQLISDTLLPFEPVFFEKDLVLSSCIEEGICLQGDPTLLRQAVEILLDNAQKYSSPNGEVLVQLRKLKRSSCLLSVSNPGESISPADLKHIFERFYRTDQARTGSGSYGLGLSIAERIVQNHRGKIWATSVGGLNTFYIQLPL